jgi:hypothetical protein
VGDRAADRASVAHLGVADLAGDLRQQGHLGPQQLGVLDVVVAGERPDAHLPAPVAHVGQVADPPDVDQHRGHGEPQPHERQQRVAAGQQLGVVTVLGQDGDGLVGGRGPPVLERGRDHRAPSPD